MPDKANCITFYSYKGGSGRSTTLVNTVMHLKNKFDASPKHPILIVDADLESAGLTYFFNCDSKFTDKFSETVHTGKIFNKAADALTNISGDIIFGKSEVEYTIQEDILNEYGSISSDAKKTVALLKNIKIPQPDINVFQKIVECHCECKKVSPDEGSKDEYIWIHYPISKLANAFLEIDVQTNLSDEDKFTKIKSILLDFLPSRRFLDVSKYFDSEPGTILFLGADVGTDESIAPNGAVRAIQVLLEQSGKKDFRAVVFDSGAGTQSTPHALHSVSDTIVYCMRPTQQFLRGTTMQLRNYRGLLKKRQEKKRKQGSSESKPVILLPTAVPENDGGTSKFQEYSFKSIEKLTDEFSNIIDDTFCNNSGCLHEVSLFKWREHILGATFVSENLEEDLKLQVQSSMDIYSTENEKMPDDAVKALAVYKKLAERIRINL